MLLSLLVTALLATMVIFWAQMSVAATPLQGMLPTVTPTATAMTVDLPPFFTPSVRHWHAFIVRWAAKHDLDPLLVATVMQIESCGDPLAVSPAGAQGLFQVMPYHFEPGENPLDPDTNARRGLAFLRRMWQRAGGDVRLTLAAYNGGPLRLEQPEAWWPAETRRYATWGWGIYQDAQAGASSSPTLQTWLAAGGARLCHQAEARLGLASE